MKLIVSTLTLCTFFCAVCVGAAAQKGLTQLAVLKPLNAGGLDFFGSSVAMSGRIIAVSCDSAVCLYVEPAGGWRNARQTATLTASDGSALTGAAVSGNTVVAVSSTGAAYVFAMPTTGWADMTETAALTASDGNGFSSAGISGNTIAAGAPGAGPNQQGAVYVFTEPSGGWVNMTQTAELTSSDGISGDYLGLSVAISGTTIVAGAEGSNTENPGATYVFVSPAEGWVDATENGKLSASDGSSGNSLGYSVAVQGATIVAGAPSQQDPNGSDGGSAYVFVEPIDGWTTMTETARLSPSNGVAFGLMGLSVSISDNLIVVGSPGAAGYSRRQLAYEFLKPAGGWQSRTQNAQLAPQKAPAYAQFGWAVASGSGNVAVGAPGSGYTDDQGLVYVFGR